MASDSVAFQNETLELADAEGRFYRKQACSVPDYSAKGREGYARGPLLLQGLLPSSLVTAVF